MLASIDQERALHHITSALVPELTQQHIELVQGDQLSMLRSGGFGYVCIENEANLNRYLFGHCTVIQESSWLSAAQDIPPRASLMHRPTIRAQPKTTVYPKILSEIHLDQAATGSQF